ncbi:peptide ABC transporter substrate-binding protein [Desulfovibrio psychrotolerans]|nr:peptide ABC transporter substrate-binding protein [Desulfovibrio psychrotolerans]
MMEANANSVATVSPFQEMQIPSFRFAIPLLALFLLPMYYPRRNYTMKKHYRHFSYCTRNMHSIHGTKQAPASISHAFPVRALFTPLLLAILYTLLLVATAHARPLDKATAPAAPQDALRILIRTIPEQFDPARAHTHAASTILADLFEGLITVGPDGELLPGAAEKWTVSPNGRTYTFRLRSNMRWSDGTSLTSRDFLYSFTRLFALGENAPRGYDFHGIEGAELPRKTGDATNLGIAAPDDRTLIIRLREPNPFFLRMLTHTGAVPVPRHAIERHGDLWSTPENLIVNGPFAISSRENDNLLSLHRNPHFHSVSQVAPNKVCYLVTEDDDNPCRMAQAGHVDIVQHLPAHQVQYAKRHMPGWLRANPQLNTYWLSLNHKDPRLASLKVRRALYLSIHREKITEGLDNGAVPAYGLIPRMKGYAPLAAPTSAYEVRLAEAALLMREAGYSDARPLRLTIQTTQEASSNLITAAIIRNWRKIHVFADIEYKTFPELMSSLRAGDYTVSRRAWTTGLPSPIYFLNVFHSASATNFSRWANPQFDSLMASAESARTPEGKTAMYQAAEALLVEQAALIPLFHGASLSLVSPFVTGWQDNPYGARLSRWLSKTLPSKPAASAKE